MEQYIPKSALVAKIDNRRYKITKGIFVIPLEGRQRADAAFEYEILGRVRDFIDTLEVIEVGVDFGDPKGDKSVKCIIDTLNLEVKEVDLDKEIDAFFNDWGKDMINGGQYGINLDIRECKDIAKHFYELGLKAQKGE